MNRSHGHRSSCPAGLRSSATAIQLPPAHQSPTLKSPTPPATVLRWRTQYTVLVPTPRQPRPTTPQPRERSATVPLKKAWPATLPSPTTPHNPPQLTTSPPRRRHSNLRKESTKPIHRPVPMLRKWPQKREVTSAKWACWVVRAVSCLSCEVEPTPRRHNSVFRRIDMI